MILGQVSWLDCIVFLVFLAPQLIIHVGFFPTLSCGLQALPFLSIRLPFSFIYDRFFTRHQNRPPFVQQASFFEDIVIRCVRYAFAYIPANIGRVFFSKPVALPFFRFRMLRHGYIHSPIHWHEIEQDGFKGIYIVGDKLKTPDIVVYYAHGGGFSMGSSYFYLEFLLAWLSLLKSSGFHNPAIFALEYTLVPDQSYPVQLQQTISGYNYVLSITKNPSKICVGGDSAGATLILSLLLYLGNEGAGWEVDQVLGRKRLELPGMAVLISPWVTLVSKKDRNTTSDYLDTSSLHNYARQYTASETCISDSLISPGNCKDLKWWRKSSPLSGLFISYGSEEVFAPQIRDLIKMLSGAGVRVKSQEERAGIHAWPVAALFLSSTQEQRQKGLKTIVGEIFSHLGS